METVAYFNDIKGVLLSELGKAKREIVAAVAWFTDPDILDLLERKVKDDVSVRLLIIEDRINLSKKGLNFETLRDSGGEVALIKGTETNQGALMHNKFTVIDGKTVITGSFNWTRRARSNYENITIIKDESDLAYQYVMEFNKIRGRHGYDSGEGPAPDYETIIRRLNAIKNLIELKDDAWQAQVEKLQPYRNKDRSLGRILVAVEKGDHSVAMELIDGFLTRRQAVEVWDDPAIDSLEFELKILKIQITTIGDEKAEIERRIEEFEYRKVAILGELISEYLYLRRQQLAKEMKARADLQEEDEEADQAFEEAEQEYEEFTEAYEEVTTEDQKPVLEKELAKKIKQIYRRASQLCHPDRVPEFLKEKAHDIFSRLSAAYRSNNIEEVEAIHERLLREDFGKGEPETITDKDKLKTEILEIRQRIERLTKEIQNLIESESWQIIATYGDWDDYFEEHKKRLQSEIDLMKEENLA
jgi:hypothetical protein